MKGNVYIFGDSYSAGDGLLKGDYTLPNPKNQLFFTEMIGKRFNRNVINLAKSGAGNWDIMKILLKTLPKITKDDIIVFSLSFPSRHFMINQHGDRQTIGSSQDYWNESKMIHSSELSEKQNESLETKFTKKTNGRSIQNIYESTLSYLEDVLEPQMDDWDLEWKSTIKEVIEVVSIEKNIPYIIWSVHSDPFRESIYEATFGKVVDYHWSWNGTRDHGNYLIKKILKKYPTLK